MNAQFFIPVLLSTNSILLAVSLISIVFFFYYVKVKFQKKASAQAYGILFYAFVFYTIAALSFVLLNAQDTFFRLNQDLYANYIWFLPIALLSAIFGAFIGWMIYFSASKIAQPYAFKMLNLSLIIIAPTLAYTLFIKPFNQTMSFLLPQNLVKVEPIVHNTLQYTELTQKPNTLFFPATPATFFDSLLIEVLGAKTIHFTNKQNGFVFEYKLPLGLIHNMYVSVLSSGKYLALLTLSTPIENQTNLLVFNKMGDCVLNLSFNDFPNHMSRSEDGNYLLLQKEFTPDSLQFKTCYRFN